MPGVDFPRFMAAVGLRSVHERCFDGWITVDRDCASDATFCRIPLGKAVPFVWSGWLLPNYNASGDLSHLTWRGPEDAEGRIGLNFSRGSSVRTLQAGLMSPR